MAPLNRVIIDTDPGVDDILAILLALAAKSDELEVLLLSLTFGNVEVRSCLRNVVSMFHVLEKEMTWRRERNQAEGFDTMKAFNPIVAVGAETPLEDQLMMADYFHGTDGLAGIHSSHPHLTPEQTWEKLFEHPPPNTVITDSSGSLDKSKPDKWFRPSLLPSHKETLRILRDNEPNTISIIAIGPLTNLAIAAAGDPETFLRVKEVIVMGGAVNLSGNVTPVAEFNTFADAVAAARVYALTSPSPRSTFPPPPPPSTLPRTAYLTPYPRNLSKQLKVTLFPLDITNRHTLTRGVFNAKVDPLIEAGSPLAEWMSAFMTAIFNKIDNLHTGHEGDSAALSLHDPLCVWYLLTRNSPLWTRAPTFPEDIRVETAGQWTRGMCIVDRRNRKLRDDDGEGGEVPGDTGNWLSTSSGNRIDRMVGSPGDDLLAGYLLDRILG